MIFKIKEKSFLSDKLKNNYSKIMILSIILFVSFHIPIFLFSSNIIFISLIIIYAILCYVYYRLFEDKNILYSILLMPTIILSIYISLLIFINYYVRKYPNHNNKRLMKINNLLKK